MEAVIKRESTGVGCELTGVIGNQREDTVIVPGVDGIATVVLPETTDHILEVSGQEAEALFAMSEKTLRKYGRAAGARVGKRNRRVYYDVIRLDKWIRANLEPTGDIRDVRQRLRELRDQADELGGGNIGQRRETPVMDSREGISSLAVPEQAAMVDIVKSQRADIRAKAVEVESVRKAVWTVGGLLVAVLIGAGCLGWLLTDTAGRLETAVAITGEKVVQIDRLNDRVVGLADQLDMAGERDDRKLAEIAKLRQLVSDSQGVRESLAERLIAAQDERLEVGLEVGRLRVEIAELQSYRVTE